MPPRGMLRTKKGQLGGGGPLKQLQDYVLSWVTGARGLQAPVSLRYLFVGDSAIVGRMRRDAQLEKNLRHRMESELKDLDQLIKKLRATTDPAQKAPLESSITERIQKFVDDSKEDLSYLTDIAKQDASLIGELGNYDKILGRFLIQIQKEGFPREAAGMLWGNLLKLSEEFEGDAKRILATAQSEYRGTTSFGLFSYKTSDTLDNMIRRIARMINNVHNQIVAEMNELKAGDTKADIESVQQHAVSFLQLMHAELNLIKTVVENDQVLIKRFTDLIELFKKKAWFATQSVSPGRRGPIQTQVNSLEQFISEQLRQLRQTAQQLEFEAQQLKQAA